MKPHPKLMKKLLSILALLAFMSVQSQTIHNPATIGQSNRNQATGRGLWVKSDTALFTSKIWIPQSAGSGKVLTSNANGFASWDSVTAISVTKAQFITLDSLGTLSRNSLYKITDVENGLFVNTTSASSFSPDATVSLFVPNYTASGNNLGQMDFDSIPSVDTGQYVIWGDHYWINETASPIIPTITDDITLGGGLTQIAKESGSIYDVLELECVVDAELNIGSLFNPINTVSWKFPSAALGDLPEQSYTYCQINAPFIANSDVTIVRNQLSDVSNGDILGGFSSQDIFASTFSQNKGNINNCDFGGSQNEFSGNVGNITTIKLVNGSRVKDNKALGGITNPSLASIGFIELFDNCEMIGNECLGDNSIIWDIRTGENAKFNGNIINSDGFGGAFSGFSDIDQMQLDECNNNIFNGLNARVEVVNQLGYSKFNGNVFNGEMLSDKWSAFQMLRSEITDNTINANEIIWKDIWMTDAKLRNATDIQVQNCTFEGIDLDLTGFTTDITSQTIQSGKGWMTNVVNFSTSTLASGDSLLFDIIPTGSYVTSIKTIGSISGAGATLSIGMQTDAASLISAPVADFADGEIYSSISAPATANRSVQLKATGGTINSGTLVFLVEFMVEQ